MYDNYEEEHNPVCILAAADTGEYDVEISIAELKELCATADIDVAAVLIQKKSTLEPATLLGMGKLEELRELTKNFEADYIIFDTELTPAQIKNIEDFCGAEVFDRTMLILDIFALHANTAEGKLQAELARLRYRLPRLTGKGTGLSRQGGGGAGGTGARRGAGESKLEIDKRHLRSRISQLSAELKELERRRGFLRERRKKDGVITVAIVGYTNVGKSTLLNYLTDAGVLAENKLFATLDPTARALTLPHGGEVMLIDTVGLVRRLPHHLVEAFKSTLEVAAEADMVLNVCDISDENCKQQLEVTEGLLNDLGAKDVPMLTVYNKCDKLDMPLVAGKNAVAISAKTGMGIDNLIKAIEDNLPSTHLMLKLNIPYSKGDVLARLEQNGKVLSREYTDTGVLVKINVFKPDLYLVEGEWVENSEE